MKKLSLPLSWSLFSALCLLNYLLGAGHELAHHLSGFLGSGHFGRISFVLFTSAPGDAHPVLTSLAGPAFTILVAWIGALLLCTEQRLWGFALVAGSHSFTRLMGVVGRGGDESVAARTIFGYLPWWQLVIAEAALVLPPLVLAYVALDNRRRPLTYVVYVFGSFLPLVALKFVDDRWFVSFVRSPETSRLSSWLGIPIPLLLAHVAVLLLFTLFGARQFKASPQARSTRVLSISA